MFYSKISQPGGETERMDWDHQALEKEIAEVNISAKPVKSEEWFR